jgi:hypothetical protein
MEEDDDIIVFKGRRIPIGDSAIDLKMRESLLKQYLMQFNKMRFYCDALKTEVLFISESIREIVFHAKKDADSTVAAMCFPELLNRAVYVRSDIPKPGNQRKGFKFDVIYELHAKYAQGKTAKVIVGARKSGLHVQYCITALKL